MNRIFSPLLVFFFVGSIALFTGCSEDDPIVGNPMPDTPPSVSLEVGAGLISSDANISLGESITIRVSLLQVDNPMESFTIKEDNVNIPTGRMTIDGGAVTVQNPFLLVGDAKKSAVYDITITTDAVADESRTYSITVSDEANLTDEVQFLVTVTGTPLTEITGALLNAGGPAGQGGLNLFTGESTGTVGSDPTAADAHIKDEGIDLDKAPAENWKQQISSINGSEIRVPGSGNVENFNYDDVTTLEALIGAFEAADELPDNADGEDVSEMVNVDDLFLVKNGDNYWLLKVTAVNPTVDDNSDSIEFSIKQ